MRTVLHLAGLVAVAALVTAVPAQAATTPKPVKYSNCTKLNKVYPHGVGKVKGVKDKVTAGAEPVTTFVVNRKVYDLNYKRLDRDRDGIVCEKL
jgi:hypothetical protein